MENTIFIQQKNKTIFLFPPPPPTLKTEV